MARCKIKLFLHISDISCTFTFNWFWLCSSQRSPYR